MEIVKDFACEAENDGNLGIVRIDIFHFSI